MQPPTGTATTTTTKRRPGRPPTYVFDRPDAELTENERRLRSAVLKRRQRQNRSYRRRKLAKEAMAARRPLPAPLPLPAATMDAPMAPFGALAPPPPPPPSSSSSRNVFLPRLGDFARPSGSNGGDFAAPSRTSDFARTSAYTDHGAHAFQFSASANGHRAAEGGGGGGGGGGGTDAHFFRAALRPDAHDGLAPSEADGLGGGFAPESSSYGNAHASHHHHTVNHWVNKYPECAGGGGGGGIGYDAAPVAARHLSSFAHLAPVYIPEAAATGEVALVQ